MGFDEGQPVQQQAPVTTTTAAPQRGSSQLAYAPPEGGYAYPDAGPAELHPTRADGKQDGDTIRAGGKKVAAGIMRAAAVVNSKVHKIAENKKEKATPKEEPVQISPTHMKVAEGLNQGTKVAASVSKKVVEVVDDTIVRAARTIAGSSGPREKKKPSTGVVAYAKASIGAVNEVMTAGEDAAKAIVTTTVNESEEYVAHVYGDDAAALAHEYGTAAKNTTDTVINVTNLPTNPKGVVKKVAKVTAKEVVLPGHKKTHAEKAEEKRLLEEAEARAQQQNGSPPRVGGYQGQPQQVVPSYAPASGSPPQPAGGFPQQAPPSNGYYQQPQQPVNYAPPEQQLYPSQGGQVAPLA